MTFSYEHISEALSRNNKRIIWFKTSEFSFLCNLLLMLEIKNKQSLKIEFKFILIAFIRSIFAPTLLGIYVQIL